ncbi:MAG: TraB/GumN family protein [Bacteroidetes bacterium]|nr:TraB/GumN family protein [Bacteroidota bacterium]
MKNLICLLFAIVQINLYAQTDGILWKVTGKELTKLTYILGTIHITCQSDKIMKPLIDSLIAKTDILATEINFTDANEIKLMMESEKEMAIQNVNEVLSPVEFALVDSIYKVLLNDTLLKYNSKSLMTVMTKIILSSGMIGCDKLEVIDILVTIKAYGMAKKIIGLDGFQFQKNILDSIPEADKKQWLLELCNNFQKSKLEFKSLENAYFDQKAEEVYKISLETSPEFSKHEKLFLTDRNIKWVNYLQANMKLNTYFVAVGAGHLGGPNGMIALLKKAGYKLTPIKI